MRLFRASSSSELCSSESLDSESDSIPESFSESELLSLSLSSIPGRPPSSLGKGAAAGTWEKPSDVKTDVGWECAEVA